MARISALMRKRERLARQIAGNLDYLVGSISTKGLKYEAYNLTTKVEGVTKTRHIPIGMVPLVKRLTRRHQELKELIKELGETNWLLLCEGVELDGHGTV